MSISWGTQYAKLKTNLRLAINRLKLIEKKKTELALKSRAEIAQFITDRKEDRARIRVEHIIREDFLVEAYELLEMYCDLLIARFGLIQQMKQLDDGIAEAVISIIWAAPRVATDISEFKVISDQLTLKYGKPFAEAARANQLEFPAKVAPKLIAKLSVHAPSKLLVERYMIEIAKSAGVPFLPDVNVMREDEVAQAEAMLIDFKNQGGQGYGWMYPPPGDGAPPPTGPPPPGASGFYPGPPPPPPGDTFGGGGFVLPQFPTNTNNDGAHRPFDYPGMKNQNSDDGIVKVNPNATGQPSAPPANPHKTTDSPPTELSFPTFPEVPNDFPEEPKGGSAGYPGIPPAGGGDLDFDDLAKRFEMLKKKKNP